ncbi:hypothetical protein B0J14DRAFT_192364 [Halenospora varia]|nr:hypothetical protein B0J14DRAFT_192364 [Halenospora varia]
MAIQITVGYVAGFLAAAFFVIKLCSQNILTLIVSGLLQDKNTASTWTVAGSALQNSIWPTLLRSDSTLSHGVRKDIWFMSNFITFMALLIGLAGIVTPLGLYQTLVEEKNVQTPFKYLSDESPFGVGTPPRSNYSLTRSCLGPQMLNPCPFTDTVSIGVLDSTGKGTFDFPYGYDINVPPVLKEIYSSGTGDDTTVSNYFDIQWRRYVTTRNERYNNGSTTIIGAFRLFDSMVLRNSYEAFEGVIVDTKHGGIGFRNHTIPPAFKYGAAWTEDILFIEPETVCVDTNITLDYTMSTEQNLSISIVDLVLTDRGGFTNLNQTFPEADISDKQKNPDLWMRAYKAAWMTNTFSMLYYNVTTMRNGTTKPFSYLNTKIGKTFAVPYSGVPMTYDALQSDSTFQSHLKLSSKIDNATVFSPADVMNATNPFNIQYRNFSSIGVLCSGAGNADFANITNILVSCGLIHGVPQRQDAGSSMVFDSGSKWSQPLYSCASAVKATVKTVSFTYNGTTDSLKNLNITHIQNKVYKDEASKPLWGVEDTGNAYRIGQLPLIWGLISPKYENHPNVSSVRQESLYLPGLGAYGDFLGRLSSRNMPGSDFYSGAIGEAYSVTATNMGALDYSGDGNMAMWVRWQNLTKSVSTAAIIPNLIWTDYAAAAVVGTKGVLGPGNAANKNLVALPVTPTTMQIRYHYAFGIPAFLTGFLLILSIIACLIVICFGRGSVGRLKVHLHQTSPGRILTTFLYPSMHGMDMKTNEWKKKMAKKSVDLSGEYPVGTEGPGPIPPAYGHEKDIWLSVYERNGSDVHLVEGERFLTEPRR